MSTRILLQTILKLRDQIKTGAANFMDVSAEYFKATGDFMDDSQKAVALEEINKIAPSNVTTLEGVDAVETVMPMGDVKPKLTLGEGKLNYPAIEKQLGVKLRGDETFDELLEIEKGGQGIGSMIPKEYYGYNRGKGGEYTKIPNPVYWDDLRAVDQPLNKSRIKNWSQRDDHAKFIRKMRGEQFENKQIRDIVKDSGGNIAEGKRAATTLKRAAEMVADTKVKQEMLSNLDEMKLDKGPRWWKGDDQYNNIEGPMGADNWAQMTKRLNDKVYYGVMEDLDNMLGEEKSYEVLKEVGGFGNSKRYDNDPTAYIKLIKEELEFNNVKYDMTFWENYVDEIMQLTTPEVPVFADGGLV